MYNFLKNKYLLLLIMSNNINLTSVNQGTLWNFNNIKTIGGPPGNTLTISGNTSLSVMNLGTNIDVSGNLNANGNMILPNGTTANRPFGVQGYLRFNTTNSVPEYYNGNIWTSFTSTTISPIIPVISTRTINIASSSNPSGTNYTWNSSFTTQTLSFSLSLIGTNNSTYAITATGGTCYALFTLLGAGGAGGYNAGTGGTGGYTCGVVPLVPGITYNLLIGQGGLAIPPGGPGPIVQTTPIGGGGLVGTLGYGGQGGGYTGLFYGNIVPGSATNTSVSPGSNSNAILLSGGGGGASYEGKVGGAGGGLSGVAGENGASNGGGGATWSGIGSTSASGGASSPALNPPFATGSLAGVVLQGGGCSDSGDGGGGGGGGGGYYGGGGGNGSNPGSGGGGGCGYIATYILSATSSTGNGSTGGSATGSGTNGVAYISYYS